MTVSKKSQEVLRGFSREGRLLVTNPADRTDGQFPDSRVGIGGRLGQGTSGLAALGAFIAQAAFGHRSEKEVGPAIGEDSLAEGFPWKLQGEGQALGTARVWTRRTRRFGFESVPAAVGAEDAQSIDGHCAATHLGRIQ